ncbi:hypothetical protein [Halobaculum sp. D14]|uniref:hypothetical protein n=1 Tax=Halobaculum sp. D14 TaxID=3421642 RepID=UPI003EB9F87F
MVRGTLPNRSVASSAASYAAAHPKAVLTAVLLVAFLATAGSAAAEPGYAAQNVIEATKGP